jgi:hypothetical protein
MNPNLIEELLNEEESPSLDFKSMQYRFYGASDDDKGELLKDILAFANSWRRTDAYILIGVDEVPTGARKNVLGITDHLKDNDLQQFVNTKTQRPLTFSYEPTVFEGKQIGIIRIPLQERPFFIKKSFGKLQADTVYIRRGSSTATAGIDEISKMGITVHRDQGVPKLNIEFIDTFADIGLGKKIDIISEIVLYDEASIERFRVPYSLAPSMENSDFPIEMAAYIAATSLLKPLQFRVTNYSSQLALNIRITFQVDKVAGLNIIEETDYPDEPRRYYFPFVPNVHTAIERPKVTVNQTAKRWLVNIHCGSIQPKASYITARTLFISSTESLSLDVDALLYGDNIPDPIQAPLQINISAKVRRLNTSELK